MFSIYIAHFILKLVPRAGLQPARDFSQRILSPSCIAIPPPRHVLRPRSDLHRRILLLQRSALATWLRGHYYIIPLFYFSFNSSKSSSTWAACWVLLSFLNSILGIGLIFKRLFKTC